MIPRSLSIVPVCLLFCVLSCEKAPQAETKTVELAYYAGSTVPEEGYPLLTLENDGDILAYYKNPDRDNTAYFLYQAKGCDDATIMFAAEDRLVFAPLSAEGSIIAPVIVLCEEDDFGYAFIGEVNAASGSFKINACVPLATQVLTKAAYNYGDDIRATLLRSFFNALNEDKDKCEILDVATAGLSSPVTSMISHILILDFVLAATELTDGAGDDLKREVGQMAKDIVVDYFVGTAANVAALMIPVKGVRPLAARVLKKMLLGKGEVITSDYAEARAEEAGPMLFSRMKKTVYSPSLFKYTEARKEYPWNVSLYVLNVGYSTALVKGYAQEASDSDPVYQTLIDQGYEYTRIRDGKAFKKKAPGLEETQLTLDPATEYSLAAYVTTFAGSKKCYSAPQRVCTRGTKLVTSASEIVFSLEGGGQTVDVEIGDCASLEVIGKPPGWCSATCEGTSVYISVKSGNTEERCEIRLQTTSKYGETETTSIVVSREKTLSWDGTSWIFKWGESSPADWSRYGDYDIIVKSVQKGIYGSYLETAKLNAGRSAGSDQVEGPSQWLYLKLCEDNSLLLYRTDSQTIQIGKASHTSTRSYQHTITRVDGNHAIMEWKYLKYYDDKLTSEESYTLNGTLQ